LFLRGDALYSGHNLQLGTCETAVVLTIFRHVEKSANNTAEWLAWWPWWQQAQFITRHPCRVMPNAAGMEKG
jgi:hypothetical protein